MTSYITHIGHWEYKVSGRDELKKLKKAIESLEEELTIICEGTLRVRLEEGRVAIRPTRDSSIKEIYRKKGEGKREMMIDISDEPLEISVGEFKYKINPKAIANYF